MSSNTENTLQNDIYVPEAKRHKVAPPPYKTFRVRGIPHSCKSNEVRGIITTALQFEDEGPGLQVCSIASNPYRPAKEKEATINFASVPSSLSGHAGKDEWQFPLPRSKLR